GLLLGNPADADEEGACWAACGRWGCTVCLARMRYERAVHFGAWFIRAGVPLWVWACPTDEWGKVRWRLTRAAGEAPLSYLRLDFGNGEVGIFATAQVPSGLDEWEELSAEKAVEQLGRTVLLVEVPPPMESRRFRPFVSSADWATSNDPD